MSSLVASRWSPVLALPECRKRGTSLREVCLVGTVRPTGPIAASGPSTGMVGHLGRTYRVASDRGPNGADPRRYLHFVAVSPDSAGD